jgi:hypothetical protein
MTDDRVAPWLIRPLGWALIALAAVMVVVDGACARVLRWDRPA